jgi:hypothetical protein
LKRYQRLQQFLIEEQSKLNYEITISSVNKIIEFRAYIDLGKTVFKECSAHGKLAKAYAHSEITIVSKTTGAESQWYVVQQVKKELIGITDIGFTYPEPYTLETEIFLIHIGTNVRAGEDIVKADECITALKNITSEKYITAITSQYAHTFMYQLAPVLCG